MTDTVTQMHELVQTIAERARLMRKHVIRMTTAAGSGHPAPSFSIVDIVATLYFSEMKIDPTRPDWPDRDLFVLSKGHAAPALYAAMREAGIITDEVMMSLRQMGSPLQGHPDMRMVGVDATSGSLGIGLSQAVGRALGRKKRGSSGRVFALIGDGECQEGQIWEAGLAAAHLKLSNLVVFVDHNHYQVGGPVSQIIEVAPLADKWRAFGWRVEEFNGHDYQDILGFLGRSRTSLEQPSMGIANTEKGYGVSFLRGGNNFHAEVLKPDYAARALAELDRQLT
jgi:transketolase